MIPRLQGAQTWATLGHPNATTAQMENLNDPTFAKYANMGHPHFTIRHPPGQSRFRETFVEGSSLLAIVMAKVFFFGKGGLNGDIVMGANLLLANLREGPAMQRLLLLICVIAISCAASAQTDRSSWTSLSGLHAGQQIQVVNVHRDKYSGVFLNVSDTAISVRSEESDHVVQRSDVHSVKLMENRHRLRNTLIGAGIGAGAGAAVGALVNNPCNPKPNETFACVGASISRGATAGIGAAGGLLIGGIVGALLPSHSTIYIVK